MDGGFLFLGHDLAAQRIDLVVQRAFQGFQFFEGHGYRQALRGPVQDLGIEILALFGALVRAVVVVERRWRDDGEIVKRRQRAKKSESVLAIVYPM